MITLIWMVVTGLGFMISGALLWEWEWKIGGIFFFATSFWMGFPKTVGCALGGIGRMISRKKNAPATEAHVSG